MKLTKLFFAAVIVLSANASFAQLGPNEATHLVNINIPEVSLLDIKYTPSATSTSTAITLAGTAPTVAGEAMTFGAAATNTDLWLNYSSIPKGGIERNVTVKITDGTVPTGLKITVEAAASAGGVGKLGTVLGEITLSSTDETPILSEIKSAYTGNGEGQGHNLTYRLDYEMSEATNYGDLNQDLVAPQLTIMYTLSEI